jgi:hypothetical protein
MNWLKKRRSRWTETLETAALIALFVAAIVGAARAQGGKGYDTEFGFAFGPVTAKGITAPAYVQGTGDDKLVLSDASGIVSTATGGGAVTLVGKVKRPAGLAIAPEGFGSFGGQIFVLAPEGGQEKGTCAVSRIEKSGAPVAFAKLPDAGSLNSGKPSDCRDLGFGSKGSPYAGKLYAVVSGNATIYEIDSSGKARAFGTFDKPDAWEIYNIGFTSATDTKAPNAMLVSGRPKMEIATKVGRIAVIDRNGKMGDTPYLVGFNHPTGFGFAPEGFGSYADVLFVADAGKWASKNAGEHDGVVYRLFKGVAREYATGLVDPTCLKFVGKTMVLCDPAAHGKPGSGALMTIAPQY